MKTKLLLKSAASLAYLCLSVSLTAQIPIPIRPLGDFPVNGEADRQQLELLFSTAHATVAAIPPGADEGFRRRLVGDALNDELESFVTNRTDSAWVPSVRLWLARNAQIHSGYSTAMDHYRSAWLMIKQMQGGVARGMAGECSGNLARLLALTGRVEELDALTAETRNYFGGNLPGSDWRWAMEARRWYRKHPAESFKCGIYCLDTLGRLTQMGQFVSKEITETASSTNGYTAADLIRIGNESGLRVHAAVLRDVREWPVPCVVHLRSEHFLVVCERRGDFYRVADPLLPGPTWLTAAEIAREATGCVLVSDSSQPTGNPELVPVDIMTAAAFRGRCHWPLPPDHNDNPCISDGTTCCGATGGGGPGDRQHGGDAGPADRAPIGAATACASCGGMPTWFVSEPYLNLWVTDIPLQYTPAYGPPVWLVLSYSLGRADSLVSGVAWHGAELGNGTSGDAFYFGRWSSSWLSFAELDASGNTVELMLPGRNWATFIFPTNSNLSEINYQQNLQLEKIVVSNLVSSLIVHHPDGGTTTYGVCDSTNSLDFNVYYMSERADSQGSKTTFSYDSGLLLTNVMAADGTTFTLQYTNVYYPDHITGVTSSYGASVVLHYGGPGIDDSILTSITDAAGITSSFGASFMALDQITTPYGTTEFRWSTMSDENLDIFERTVRITHPDGAQEFYALLNEYGSNDWPAFAASQIPTNTPLNTLDTTERDERNTFYWNRQQFAPYAGLTTPLPDMTWADLKKARIRHWLATTDPIYSHFDTLSLEQSPSPDGTTEGQITWYDYAGKPTGITYERGSQVNPAVIARVMPDGSTWYEYQQYNNIGHSTNMIEKWVGDGTTLFRTNSYFYAANNVDMYLHMGPNGEQVSSNRFNAYHQVTTNYDALNQATLFTYDATTFQLTSITRPTGLITTNLYDGNHRLQQMTDLPINATRSYTWGTDGNLKSLTDERGLTITNYWDGLNRLTGRKYPDGTTTSNLYTIDSAYPSSSGGLTILDVTATKDRLGFWTYIGYDSLQRKIAVTNANNVITRYGYCDCGAVSFITNAWNTSAEQVIIKDYDFQGHALYTHYPDVTVTNWFDALGRMITVCDPWGCRWLGYDNLSRLTSITNAFGAERLTTYDIEDRPIYVTDANNVTITNTYDDLGQLLTRTYPDAGVERFGYSARGLTVYTNQLSFATFYAYDEAGRKTFETNANTEIIRYTNNAAGDLLSLTDGKNQTTKWNYDEYGRVTNKLDQLGVEILRYTYDANSRLASRWSKAKGTTYYTNDAVGNLLNINYPASTDVTFAYDALNRVTNMVDAAGTTTYSYAAGGQLWTEDGPWSSDTVTNTYSYRLRTALSLQQPTGLWTNGFGYDAAKRLTNVTSPAGPFSYSYHASRLTLLDKLSLPNTSYITNRYDSAAQLTGTWLKKNDDTTLNSHAYTYNVGHQRTQQTFTDSSTYDYGYDAIGQLTIGDSSVAAQDRGYTYDAAWNLNFRTNNGVLGTFSVDGKNQLTSAPDGGCGYDNNGNLIGSAYDDEAKVSMWGYEYDDENQLARLTYSDVPDGGEDPIPLAYWDFRYDGRGRLRERTNYFWSVGSQQWTLSGSVRYVYDGMRVIQERNSANTPTVSYTRGDDLSGTLEGAGGIGGLLARSVGYSSGTGNWSTHHYYHADGNGNITYLVSGSQTLGASYRYDPFGNTVSSSGGLASANVYRFSSKEIHVNSGLYYYGYRWYAPGLQRWPNRDPIGEAGGFNVYRFVNNDPISQFDPFGQRPKPTPPPGMDYDPNCYAKCGKQNLIELGLCTGLLAGTTVFCIFQPAVCLAALKPLLAAQAACFAAAELHYAACLGSCLVTKKCPYPLGPYPGGFMDFP